MKKIFYLLLFAVFAGGLTACEDDTVQNPGDFNLKATLELSPEIVGMGDFSDELKLAWEKDTTWAYPSIERDTVVDGEGKPVLDESGKIQVNVDTSWVKGRITGHLYEYELMALPSKADTFTLSLKSNARWKAPVPSAGGKVQWFYNYNLLTGSTSTSGGGDGHVYFRVTRNRNKKRAVTAVQNIYTSDSTVFVRLRFTQKGERDKK